MRKILSLFALLLFSMAGTAMAQDWTPNIPAGYLISVGGKVSSVTPATSADDNSHWYLVTQVRGGESAIYDNGTQLMRGSTSATANSFNGKTADTNASYLVRFIEKSGAYNVQLGTGRFVAGKNSNNKLLTSSTSADLFLFYNCNNGNGSYFGWNLTTGTNYGDIVDNDAAGNTVGYWSSGQVEGTSGNNVWYVYSVTLEDPNAFVNVTYNLVENGNPVSSTVVQQEKNSAISVPSSLASNTLIYDYTTEGTIGETDCTITVTRTLKPGVVTAVSDLSNSKLYTITPYDMSRGHLSALASDGALHTKGANNKFALYTYEGNTYLYNFDAGKFVDNQGTISGKIGTYFPLVDVPSTNVAVAPATYDYTFTLKMNGANCINASNGWSYGAVGAWNTLDPGNQFYIIAVEDMTTTQMEALEGICQDYFHPSATIQYVIQDAGGNTIYTSEPVSTTVGAVINTTPAAYVKPFTTITEGTAVTTTAGNNVYTSTATFALPFEVSTDFDHAVWYYMNIRDTKWVYYNGTDAQPKYNTSGYEKADGYMWAFFGNPYTGIVIQNKAGGANKFLHCASTPAVQESDDENWHKWDIFALNDGFALDCTQDGENYTYFIHDFSNSFSYWNDSNAASDNGSCLHVVKVPTPEEEFNQIISLLENYPYGTALGQYGLTGDYAGYETQMATILDGLKTAGYSEANLTIVQGLHAATSLNMPKPNTFLYIQSVNGANAYLKAAAAGTRETFTTTKDINTVFLLDAEGKLISYATGIANNNVREAGTVDGAASLFTVVPAVSGNVGQYSLGATFNSSTNYLYSTGVDGSNADRNTLSTSFLQQNSFYLEAVTELPVTISAAGYATFCAPVATTIPAGVKAYIGKTSGEHLALTEVEGTIPANEPVVLEGAEGTYNFAIVESTATADAANELSGTTAATAAPANTYTLQQQSGVVGFYPYSGTNLRGFGAYLQNTSGVRGFIFETTGINSLLNAESNGVAYDLQGRRVMNAQKGLYILRSAEGRLQGKNGKKVLVK